MLVVSVDYRLPPPEHAFPISLLNCQDVLNHIGNEADDFGIDPRRLGVAGDSAGGNLSAALALKSLDNQGPAFKNQLLIYPVIDAACDTKSYHDYADGYGLSKDDMQIFWRSYLGVSDRTEPLASLNHNNILEGLPPTRIITAEYDVLRDEAFAKQLNTAKVHVELERYKASHSRIRSFLWYHGSWPRCCHESGQTTRRAATKLAQFMKTRQRPPSLQRRR